MKTNLIIFIFLSLVSQGKSVNVRGYVRKDGVYVQPHIRSGPDSSKSNNYGPAKSAGSNYSGGYTSPYLRDSDQDGISNNLDSDDDNDGIADDNE